MNIMNIVVVVVILPLLIPFAVWLAKGVSDSYDDCGASSGAPNRITIDPDWCHNTNP